MASPVTVPSLPRLVPGAVPLHAQAERALRTLVATLPAGELLPPETVMAEQLGISRLTIRAAMQRLVDAGLVARRSGRGTEVLERSVDLPLGFAPLPRLLEASGHTASVTSLKKSKRRPDEAEQEALGITATTEVTAIRRTLEVDGQKWAVLDTTLAPGVAAPDDGSTPLYDALEAAGVHLVQMSDRIHAILADTALARALKVEVGAPLLAIERVARDTEGRAVEFTRSYLRGNAGYAVEHKR